MSDHPNVLLAVMAALPVGMIAMGWKLGDFVIKKGKKERK